MKNTQKIELISLDELVPYANNARMHSNDQIKLIRASLREYGFVNPILIDGEKNIIAGHGRYEAAKAEGMERVPCVIVDFLTDAQKRAYILADNKIAEMSTWDMDMVSAEIEKLQDDDFDVSLTGFDDSVLADQEPIELDDCEQESSSASGKKTAYCPKCGFEFEV